MHFHNQYTYATPSHSLRGMILNKLHCKLRLHVENCRMRVKFSVMRWTFQQISSTKVNRAEMEMKKLKYLLIQADDIEGKIGFGRAACEHLVYVRASGCEKCFLKCENAKLFCIGVVVPLKVRHKNKTHSYTQHRYPFIFTLINQRNGKR